MSGPKRLLAGKSRGKLLSPFVFPRLPTSPQSPLQRRFQARPFRRLEEAHLSFPEKGVPWELREVQRCPVTLIRDVKGEFGNPLLPPPAATALLRRRLQVEKSPVGRKGSGSSPGGLCPEILEDWNLCRRSLCALESRGLAAARDPAHHWPSGSEAHLNQLGLHPAAPSPFGTERTES